MARSRAVTAIFVVLLVAAALLLARLLWVFVTAIVLALVVVSLFQPVFAKVLSWTGGRRQLAAGITTLAVVLGVMVPAGLFVASLSRQAFELYAATRQTATVNQLLEFLSGEGPLGPRLQSLLARFNIEFDPEDLVAFSSSVVKGVGLFLYERLSGAAANAFTVLLHFGVMVLLVYTFLVEGPALKRYVMDLSPLPDDEEEEIVDRFKRIARAVFLGNGAASVIQGVLGGLGFLFFGLGSGVFWGAVMGFLAFLPIVGASVVFIPAAIYLFFQGKAALAVGFLAYNFAYVAVVEYVLKPRLIGGQSRMHTVLVFLGILAGLKLFGILGLFYGPLLITMFLALVDLYRDRYRIVLIGDEEAKAPVMPPAAEYASAEPSARVEPGVG